jgi:DnaK suppressor protein
MLTKEQREELKAKLLEELALIEERNREIVAEMEQFDGGDTFHGDEADQATFMEQRSRMLRLRDRDRKLINKIRKTLQDIDSESYGTCESCGIEISFERLKMRPVASLCIECKKEQEEREDRDKMFKRR